MSEDVITVVLADDHQVVRTGLKAILSMAKDISVIGEASNGEEAIAAAERFRPQVLVLDLDMPGMDGIATLQEIKTRGVPVKTLILTMHQEEEYLVQVLQAGAGGYLVKTAADKELVDAVRMVAYGDLYVRPSASKILARGVQKNSKHSEDRERYNRLADREKSVLRYVALGHSAAEIGEKLHISPKTVDTYKQRISEKLDITHRSDYVQLALKLGLLTEE